MEYKPNPITKIFPFVVGGFAWQVFGIWIGVGAFLGFVVVNITLNLLGFFYLSKLDEDAASTANDSARIFQTIKWCLLVFSVLAIMYFGADKIEISG